MLRVLVLLLLLANAAWFAWAQGALRSWGLGPTPQSEPQRLERQLRPELLRIAPQRDATGSLPPVRPMQASVSLAGSPTNCLLSGVLDPEAASRVEALLADWPQGSWQLVASAEPARWIVYMGRYPSPEHLQRKRAELRQRGVAFEALANAELEPGLSLGGFSSEAEARQQLDALVLRGVRTASVVQEQPERSGQALRLLLADAALPGRVEAVRAALAGQPLRPCR